MSDEQFIEFLKNFGLYRKYKNDSVYELVKPSTEKPSLTLFCKTCKKDERKFKYEGDYRGVSLPTEMPNMLKKITYKCVECEKQLVQFWIYANLNKNYLMKIGQWPSWLPSINKNLEEVLGDNLEIYKKGLYCENEGCGIGAFAYYRRVVENVIDGLLDDLDEAIRTDDTLKADDRYSYGLAYRRAKESKDATSKIECAFEMLPKDLIEGISTNPLKMLHSALSIGLHSDPDEKCLHSAGDVRTALNYLVKGIFERKYRTQKKKEKIDCSIALKKLEKNFTQQSSGDK
jgi:tetratricopeptide (TPR) repeat protein